ncbi:MAG: ribosome silencing factor [Spirochaetaceae bacterium]|jgi:ribosome-associated protein|nr:ribosome silencing factor [Spirochaetaceae bacterium]
MQEMRTKALELGRLLQEHKGEKVTVLDISRLNSWTDYFVIAAVNSSTHSKGLYKHIKDYARENGLHIHLTKRKTSNGDDWNLIDFGPIVIHLMTEEARNFYELEKLWHEGTVLM